MDSHYERLNYWTGLGDFDLNRDRGNWLAATLKVIFFNNSLSPQYGCRNSFFHLKQWCRNAFRWDGVIFLSCTIHPTVTIADSSTDVGWESLVIMNAYITCAWMLSRWMVITVIRVIELLFDRLGIDTVTMFVEFIWVYLYWRWLIQAAGYGTAFYEP